MTDRKSGPLVAGPGEAQILPAEFARRMRAIAAATLMAEERRRLVDALTAETLRSLGYGDGLDAMIVVSAPGDVSAAAQAVERARAPKGEADDA